LDNKEKQLVPKLIPIKEKSKSLSWLSKIISKGSELEQLNQGKTSVNSGATLFEARE